MASPTSAQNSLKSDDSPGKPRARRPRRFGRLTLLKPIARGGMGEVFLATAGGIEGAERPCVVKIIRREHAKDKSFLARFFDEARIQAQLHHPGVAQILEASTDPSGKPFVVVEHIEGRNLGEARQRARELNVQVSWADAVAIAVSLAEALAHIHERMDADGKPLEIAHRDLSPQNVMLSYGGEVKLIDFGTARGENRHCHTVNGVVFAKPGYVAPEVANNTPGAAPADLYALGIILWELVAGRRFLSGEAKEHLAAVAKGEKNPPALAPFIDVPMELDTVVARLTAPRIEDRYGSAREALTDLLRLIKRAPALADGERGVRARIAHLMSRLYPAEPARCRAEFARLVAGVRRTQPKAALPQSPTPAPATASDMFPGTRYRLLGELSRGPMGVVYRAHHVDLGRAVALKVLPKECCANPEEEARFRAEARSIAQLKHDNLVNLHDFGVSTDGRPYYAMELLEGETLRQLIDREQGVDMPIAIDLAIQACRALEVAHTAGVVHRDLKPGNLFLTKSGTLKLIDFGIAGPIELESEERGDDALHVAGTPEYMAPEQASRNGGDERADLYALGAVLFEMLTGTLPHQASSLIELLDAKRHAVEAPSKRSKTRRIPRVMDRIVVKLLAAEPDARFESAAAARAALEDLRGEAKDKSATGVKRRIALAAIVLGAVGGGIVTTRWLDNPDYLDQVRRALPNATQDEPAEFDSELEPRFASAEGMLAGSGAAADPREDSDELALNEVIGGGSPAAVDTAAIATAGRDTATIDTDEHVDDSTGASTQADIEEPGADESDDSRNEAAAAPSDEASEPSAGVEGEDIEANVTGDDANVDEPTERAALTEAERAEQQLDEDLTRLEDWIRRNKNIMALNEYRELSEKHPNNTRLLAGWSRAARKTKGWGESLRIAIRWASLDEGAEAQLHLARIQRSVGQRYGAVATLQRLLEREPDNAEALRLLEKYGGRVAMQ